MASPTAFAATLVALDGAGPGDFVLLRNGSAAVGRIGPTGAVTLRRLDCRATVASPCADGVFLFAGRQAWRIGAQGGLDALPPFAEPIRAAAPVGSRLALVVGGQTRGGDLHGGTVALWDPAGGAPRPVAGVLATWNPYALRSAPDRASLLVGMRKSTHFDPFARPRPFLYRWTGETIVPLWRGTSFALPHLDMALADVTPDPGVETCALEQWPDGRRRVAAYTWAGYSVAGVAVSEAGWLGGTLQPVGRDALGVFARHGAGWQFRLLRGRNSAAGSGVLALSVSAYGPAGAAPPAAWTTVSRADGVWLVCVVRTPAGLVCTATRVLP